MARSPKSAPAARKSATRRKPSASRTPAASPPAPSRALAWSLGGVALAAAAGLVAFLTRGRIAAPAADAASEGHVPTDLLDPDRTPGEGRAPVAFRPDMSAPMTPTERAALAPATGGAPSLIADRGTMRSEPAPGD